MHRKALSPTSCFAPGQSYWNVGFSIDTPASSLITVFELGPVGDPRADGNCSISGGFPSSRSSRPWQTNRDTRRQAFFGHQPDTKTPEAGWASGAWFKYFFQCTILVAGPGFEPGTFRL